MNAISFLRSGAPPLALLALALVAGPAVAAGKDTARLPATHTDAHHVLSGSLTPPAAGSLRGGAFALSARLASSGHAIPLQEGSGFALIARLAVTPLVCYGDTIFRDGLDL
ncbi:MAG: hypothetical protein DWB45_03855 [Xanthomonadales bacterium]|nr:MAG: hypothetical protein F9K31_06610 [Dokdonella sp.]MBC6941842.1 hypothetical protein [Xanthomonadales bacterium]MCC6594905.1 hypothetical protein [Rhodanobacteraceae bacterium]MDL1868131.1 hypothetical protein [Gammaproteobacteria bacterium PRO6]